MDRSAHMPRLGILLAHSVIVCRCRIFETQAEVCIVPTGTKRTPRPALKGGNVEKPRTLEEILDWIHAKPSN
ncbi:hypothetical protein FB451DRAFT_1227030 [Mycena latifolia]|nr:hypothetical protein FB451DRAFT_1227030 [Mycena latifolia]